MSYLQIKLKKLFIKKSRRVLFFKNEGQLMVITVIILGSVFLGATTIAGLLTLYRIRQAASSVQSAQAFFAADAGLERALYECFVENIEYVGDPNYDFNCAEIAENDPSGISVLENFARFKTNHVKLVDLGPGGIPTERIKSRGRSGNSVRALEFLF